jgi:hypothetical protein
MKPLLRTLSLATTAVLAGGLLAACGGSSDASGGSPTLSITSPASGATVGRDVAVSWDTNEQLGPPDSGRDHVHVFVDGHSNDYTVVGGNSFTVKGLSAGQHTIDVTLQHADHSSAGAHDEVDVTVSPTGTAPSSPPTSQDTQSSGSGSGYGY